MDPDQARILNAMTRSRRDGVMLPI
jgi:hypothetical protein